MTCHLPAGYCLNGDREGRWSLLRPVQPVPDVALLNLEPMMLTKSASERRLTANQVAGTLQEGEFGVIHAADDTRTFVALSTNSLVEKTNKDLCSIRRMETIGQRVRLRREELGLSQGELASLVGKRQQNIEQLENGRVGQPRYLTALARALRVELAWLEKGEGPKETAQPPLTTRHLRVLALLDQLPDDRQEEELERLQAQVEWLARKQRAQEQR